MSTDPYEDGTITCIWSSGITTWYYTNSYTQGPISFPDKAWIQSFEKLTNKIDSFQAITVLANIRRIIADVTIKSFIHKVMSIRQPKPKSSLRAKLYK